MVTLKLRAGHQTPFYRTVVTGSGAKQKEHKLCFLPNEPQKVSKEVAEGLAKEIGCGLLVDPANAKQVVIAADASAQEQLAAKDATIATLQARVSELEAALAEAEGLLDEIADEEDAEAESDEAEDDD